MLKEKTLKRNENYIWHKGNSKAFFSSDRPKKQRKKKPR